MCHFQDAQNYLQFITEAIQLCTLRFWEEVVRRAPTSLPCRGQNWGTEAVPGCSPPQGLERTRMQDGRTFYCSITLEHHNFFSFKILFFVQKVVQSLTALPVQKLGGVPLVTKLFGPWDAWTIMIMLIRLHYQTKYCPWVYDNNIITDYCSIYHQDQKTKSLFTKENEERWNRFFKTFFYSHLVPGKQRNLAKHNWHFDIFQKHVRWNLTHQIRFLATFFLIYPWMFLYLLYMCQYWYVLKKRGKMGWVLRNLAGSL